MTGEYTNAPTVYDVQNKNGGTPRNKDNEFPAVNAHAAYMMVALQVIIPDGIGR
jgi:hypothetical protein